MKNRTQILQIMRIKKRILIPTKVGIIFNHLIFISHASMTKISFIIIL